MFKNYFMLNRFVVELNSELKNYIINRIFSFEKDKLLFLLNKNQDELSLEISVNPGSPFINLKRRSSVPKKNMIDFFNLLLPLNISSIEMAEGDRIIAIKSGRASFYFSIRGKFTNVYCISAENEIESFKKVEEKIKHDFKEEILRHNFISEFNILKMDEQFVDPENIRKKFPVIGKEILNEAKLRGENDEESISANILLEIIKEIKENSPAVFIDEAAQEVHLGINTFSLFPFTKKEKFSSVLEAMNFFLYQKFSRGIYADKKKIIEKHFEKELSRTSSRLNDVKARLERGTKEEEYSRIANLLLININRLIKGISQIDIQDIYNDNNIQVKLDSKLSPRQNVDSYFDKARNEKIKFERSKKQLVELKEKFSRLTGIKKNFETAKTNEDYDSIMKELKIKNDEKKNPQEEIKNKFRHYLISGTYNVYVGKESKSNDLLTMKFAKQNDYWFHARGVPGSHLVLKNENSKEGIPKNILKAAASLAAYHSKAKTAGMVPVSFTQKKYVVKKKGMEPGKVALLREEVLIVRPGIPDECEYISAE